MDVVRRFAAEASGATAIVVEGRMAQWARRPVELTVGLEQPTMDPPAVPEHLLGTWIDEKDFVHQHLSADGRYDETRGGRKHAFQGAFWIDGNRVDYRDDLGFWAFGEFADGLLHHAGYTFHRA